MRKLKAEQKRKIAGIIAIVLIASMVLSVAVPMFWVSVNAAPAKYTIEANIGFDGGYTKINSNVPVEAKVTDNTGKGFDGELAVYIASSQDGYGDDVIYDIYSTKIYVPEGGSANASLTVPIEYIQRQVSVKLIKNNKVVESSYAPIAVTRQDEVWCGALTNSGEDNLYSRGYDRFINITDYAKRGNIDFGIFNSIIVNDFDFAALNSETLTALAEYVENGGVLILQQNSYIGNFDKLPFAENYTEFGLGGNKNRYYSYGTGYVFNVQEDNDYLDVSSFLNLSDEFGEQNAALSFIDDISGINWNVSNNEDTMYQVIFGIIYLYIFAIPVLYFVLKKKDRREDAIKFIPIGAVVVSVIIYLLSWNTVYKKPIADVINYINTSGVSTQAEVPFKSCMRLTTPYKGEFNIVPTSSVTFEGINKNQYRYYDYNSFGTQPQAALYDENDIKVRNKITKTETGYEILRKNAVKWDKTYLNLGGKLQLQGGIECGLDGDFLTITNNTGLDLEQVYIVGLMNDYNGQSYCVEKIDGITNGSSVGKNLQYTDKSLHYLIGKVMPSYKGDKSDYAKGNCQREILAALDNAGSNAKNDYLRVVAFNYDNVWGEDTLINNKKPVLTTTNIFKQEVKTANLNYGLKESLWGVIDGAQTGAGYIYPEITPVLLEKSNGNKIVCDDNKIFFNFKNNNRSDFFIEYDNSIGPYQILNNTTMDWKLVSENHYGDGLYSGNEYTDAEGRVHVSVYGSSGVEIDLPKLYFIN